MISLIAMSCPSVKKHKMYCNIPSDSNGAGTQNKLMRINGRSNTFL